MTRIAALFALLAAGCSASASPRDPQNDLNLCEEVATGATPVALLRRDDFMFAAGDPIVLSGHLFFRTASIGGLDGGIFDLALDTRELTSGPSGNISNLAGAHDVLYWYDWGNGLFKNDGNGWYVWGIYALEVDPKTNDAWFTKDGELHHFANGDDWLVANGKFDRNLAIGAAGVYAIVENGKDAELRLYTRDMKSVRTIATYTDETPIALKADAIGAVVRFPSGIAAISPSGDVLDLVDFEPDAKIDGKQLALDESHVYYSEKSDFGYALRRVPRDGSGGVETLVDTRCTPQSLTVSGGSVYWSTYRWNQYGANPGAIWSLPKTPENP